MQKRDRAWCRFRVIRQLGAGAFGRTLLVVDTTKDDRQVVIKVPHDKEKEKALLHEVMNVSALRANLEGMKHPNIVPCLGFDTFEGYYVMIMEYVQGRDLRSIIGPMASSRKPMAMKRALQIVDNVCSGLVAAHRVNVLHRDVKPENIMVRDEDGVAKLCDFGISTIVQSSTIGSGTVAGTFPYMAPEAFVGKASYAADLWSLSATLYELATGRLPFWDENLFVLKQKIESETPVAPQVLNPAIDERLNALILKGLEKSPKHRFASAQEMLDVLGPDVDQEIVALRRLFQEDQEDEAERRARALLERFPKEPRLFMLLAAYFNRRQQFQRTEDTVRRGIAACPDHADLHFYLALALWNQGPRNGPRAIAAMQRALDLGLSSALEKTGRALLSRWKPARRPS